MAAQHEPWSIRLSGDEAVRRPGANLRDWAGDDRSNMRRFVDRLLARDDRDAKLSGALGEELVGRELAKLGDGWTVLHGLRIGPRADIDHLVIGPAGVFTLDTKRIAFEADVVVSPRRFCVNGYSRDYYPKAVKQASRVADRLRAATGAEVGVRPLLVITGAQRNRVTIQEQPADVTVVLRRGVREWLLSHPSTLDAVTVELLSRKARRPGTWDPSKVDVILDRTPTPAEPVVPVAPDGGCRVTRWRRYGHDRLYINDAETGARLGWRDEKTGAVHVEVEGEAARVHSALATSVTLEPRRDGPA